jgi:hypothetical protein
MRSFVVALLIVVASPFLVAPASAMWGVGANLGATVEDPVDPGESTTRIGAPASTLSTLRPGLRLSYSLEGTGSEAYFDVGFDGVWQGDENASVLRLGGNYQYNFGHGPVRPFVTGGAGLLNIGGSSFRDTMTGMVGGGVGVGIPLARGAGRFRVEARADRILEAKYQTVVIIGETTLYQFGVGFDLWMR